MPKITLPPGLRGEENSPKQIESVINYIYRGGPIGTLAIRPGIDSVDTLTGSGRGIGIFKDQLYTVSGTRLLRITPIDPDAELTEDNLLIENLGFIPGNGPCQLEGGFTEIVILVVGAEAFMYNDIGGLQELSNGYTPSISMTYDGGRYVFIPNNGSVFYWAFDFDLPDFTAQDFADAEEFPDPNKAVWYRRQSIYVAGTRSVEQLVFDPVINTYRRNAGVSSNIGYVGGANDYNEAVAFLGRGNNGGFSFYIMTQQAIPISGFNAAGQEVNKRVDEILATYELEELEGITSDYFSWLGQDIIIFHLPRHTLVYYGDWALWHTGTSGQADSTLSWGFVQFAYGTQWALNFDSNILGALTETTNDYDLPIETQIDTYIRSEEGKEAIINYITLECTKGQNNDEAGVGLSISRNGILYHPEVFRDLGVLGDNDKQIRWGAPIIKTNGHVAIRLRSVGVEEINIDGLSFS